MDALKQMQRLAGAEDWTEGLLARAKAWSDTLIDRLRLLRILIDKGEKRRLGRISDVKVTNLKYDGTRLTATVIGTSDTYETRIVMSPRGHHCTCPDWQNNGKMVGPCKHVLALAIYWKDTDVEPALVSFNNKLRDMLGGS